MKYHLTPMRSRPSRTAQNSLRMCLSVLILLLAGTHRGAAQAIPITIDVPVTGYVTLVIDDAQGNRVRNPDFGDPAACGQEYDPVGRLR